MAGFGGDSLVCICGSSAVCGGFMTATGLLGFQGGAGGLRWGLDSPEGQHRLALRGRLHIHRWTLELLVLDPNSPQLSRIEIE